MTWGQQNTEEDAWEQMDYAVSRGINFFDTAELYPVPMNPNTQGRTEEYIGRWMKTRKNRNEIILATKATGPGPKHIRTEGHFSKKGLSDALEGSLRRLQTDYIDLYQLHWPERHTNRFGILNYEHNPSITHTPFEEVIETLESFIQEGKIRYYGLSNETPWGMMKFLQVAEKLKKPKFITIQNPYNLINRVFEISHSEVCHRENVGLLAYSPLGGGLLSGKYIHSFPENSRYSLFPNYFGRYKHPNTAKAVALYHQLAEESGLSTTIMSLAFVNSRSFITANIIGATSMDQLKENISSIDVELNEEIIRGINRIHFEIQNPAP